MRHTGHIHRGHELSEGDISQSNSNHKDSRSAGRSPRACYSLLASITKADLLGQVLALLDHL